MKLKKMMICLTVTMVTALMVSSAYAATYYATAAVAKTTTTTNGATLLHLSDTATPPKWTGNQWFTVPAGADDQALAVALTAISLDKTLRVTLPDPTVYTLSHIGLNK